MSTVQGFRIELGVRDPAAAERLRQHAGLSRVVYNECLRAVKANLGQREAEKSYGVADADLTPALGWSAPALEQHWRDVHPVKFPWFAAEGLSSRPPKAACRNLAAALANFKASKKGARKGKRVGFPRRKTLRDGRRFTYDQARCRPLDHQYVRAPNVGVLRAREDMSWLTERLTAGTARVLGTTLREQGGRWWVSFKVELDRSNLDAGRAAPRDGSVAGVDLGLTTLATIAGADGSVEEVSSLRPLLASARKVRRLNRKVARTEKGSKNRTKAVEKLGRAHLRAANRRSDYLHKLTTRLATTKQTIVVEDLAVAGMGRNRSLARAVHDAAFGEFRRQLEYKATWYGATVIVADRWYPSTKTCSACGHVKASMGLGERSYDCEACGLRLGRDVNAARNLAALADPVTTLPASTAAA